MPSYCVEDWPTKVIAFMQPSATFGDLLSAGLSSCTPRHAPLLLHGQAPYGFTSLLSASDYPRVSLQPSFNFCHLKPTVFRPSSVSSLPSFVGKGGGANWNQCKESTSVNRLVFCLWEFVAAVLEEDVEIHT
jgi:hypothetical protein